MFPVDRSSMTVTRRPDASNASTACDPMKPQPPVTRTVRRSTSDEVIGSQWIAGLEVAPKGATQELVQIARQQPARRRPKRDVFARERRERVERPRSDNPDAELIHDRCLCGSWRDGTASQPELGLTHVVNKLAPLIRRRAEPVIRAWKIVVEREMLLDHP